MIIQRIMALKQEEKFELIKRNSAELITEEEIRKLLEEKKNPVTYCGYEVSGEVHLGHLVTITKLLDLQKAGFHVKVLFADWHTWLNKKGEWSFIHEMIKKWEKAFKALGLEKAEYVLGSSFQRTQAYIDDLLTLSLNTTVNRSLRSMQEVARDFEHATVSQMIYPLMQINDIKYLDVDLTEAGIEQRKIHALAREIMNKINFRKPLFVHTPLINSLQGPGKKMSSSVEGSLISVQDEEAEIKKKIAKAHCLEGVTENNPMLEITKLILFPHLNKIKIERDQKFGGDIEFNNYNELEKSFEEKELHPMDLKNAVARDLNKILAPMRKKLK